jgi:predicted O-methyltransferase YrrM
VPGVSTLDSPRVRSALSRLHAAARADVMRMLPAAPRIVRSVLAGWKSFDPGMIRHQRGAFLSVSPEQGRLLYVAARAAGATRAVEFGTSFGVSTIYLAAAVRDNGGGRVVGTELEPSKVDRARANLEEAGLADLVEIRAGDALETLADLSAPIDFVLLDGRKDLYLPVLELVKPKLRRGAIVVADDVRLFGNALRAYVDHVKSDRSGFVSTTLSVGHGFEFSVRTDGHAAR